jgi:sarcosine oxidase gamma subunit
VHSLVDVSHRQLGLSLEIVLWRQANRRFRFEVWRSLVDYLIALICDAARGAPDF